MEAYMKSRQRRSFLSSWTVVLALFLIASWVSFQAFKIFWQYQSNVEQLDKVKEEQAALAERSAYLNETIERLKTDEGIEEEIRAKLPYSKEGEQIILIVEPIPTSSARVSSEDDIPWWQFWK